MYRSDDEEQVELVVDNVIAVTDKACLVEIVHEQYWFPWSQIDEGSEIESVGDSGLMWIPLWLAEEKELA